MSRVTKAHSSRMTMEERVKTSFSSTNTESMQSYSMEEGLRHNEDTNQPPLQPHDFITHQIYIMSLSTLSFASRICGMRSLASLVVMLAAITERDTPAARPKAVLLGTNTYGTFYPRSELLRNCVLGGWKDLPYLRIVRAGEEEWPKERYQQQELPTRLFHD